MMRSFLIIITCFSALSASPVRFEMRNSDLDAAWSSYKINFQKQYPSVFHETVRRIQWELNLRYIEKHNLEADLGRHSYRLGMNEFGDLSNAEYKQLLNFHSRNVSQSQTYTLPLSGGNLRIAGDGRAINCTTPVQNQGQLGASWAISAVECLESQICWKTGRLTPLSVRNLIDCVRFHSVAAAFAYIAKNGGIDTEAGYPKDGKIGDCRFKRSAVGAKVSGIVDIPYGNEDALRQAVATLGTISTTIDASHPSFQLYRDGVYNEPNCSSTQLDHAVVVVGFGTLQGQDYWLVKNSWGTTWGRHGYILMSRNKHNQCGIASMAMYPLAEPVMPLRG